MRVQFCFSNASWRWPLRVSVYDRTRRPSADSTQSPCIHPSCSMRCKAGNNEPAFTWKVPLVIWAIRSAMADPCIARRLRVRKINRSSVPLSNSADCSAMANINETFLAAGIREQGEKELIHDRWSDGWVFGDGHAGSGSDAEGEAAQLQCLV